MSYEISYEEAYEMGRDWGSQFNEIADAPDIGDDIEQGYQLEFGETVTEDNRIDYLTRLAFETEENARQFAGFEDIASYINESEYPDEAWDAFDEGVADAIREGIAAFYT